MLIWLAVLLFARGLYMVFKGQTPEARAGAQQHSPEVTRRLGAILMVPLPLMGVVRWLSVLLTGANTGLHIDLIDMLLVFGAVVMVTAITAWMRRTARAAAAQAAADAEEGAAGDQQQAQ